MDLSHRKVAKTLKIVDSSGNPASNKRINVKLKNHEFLFGCGAFDSIPYVMGVNDPSLPPVEDTMNKWLDLFNYGTLPFYWGMYDWQVDEWPTTPEGEERQAKEIEEIYRTLFAHPQVEAITTWDFKDGAWLGAPSGFLRKDNSIKPSYEMLKKLIHEEWNTDETLVTDENGYVKVEGFKGEYEISSSEGKTTVKLTDNEEMIVVL